jgi:hypothetical protein
MIERKITVNDDEIIETINRNVLTTIPIIVDHVNPKIHKRFRKHLKRKYEAKNVEYHFSRELNTAIYIYAYYVQLPDIMELDASNSLDETESVNVDEVIE